MGGPDLMPIDGNVAVFSARIPQEDFDKPIRRIFPLWLFQRALRLRQLALASPYMWEDPHEDPASLCMLNLMRGVSGADKSKQQSLSAFLARAWGQCWSLNPGSDTLLRAYSRVILDPLERRNVDPRNEGVSVTSTPRLLISAMKGWANARPDSHFILGRVRYLPEDEIGQFLANVANGDPGPAFFRTVQGRGESLFLKRDYFRHEDEVRLLCIQRDEAVMHKDVRTFGIDPNAVFTEVSFDPRLVDFERLEREGEARRLGYTGPIRHDLSYQKVVTLLQMTKGWETS